MFKLTSPTKRKGLGLVLLGLLPSIAGEGDLWRPWDDLAAVLVIGLLTTGGGLSDEDFLDKTGPRLLGRSTRLRLAMLRSKLLTVLTESSRRRRSTLLMDSANSSSIEIREDP